MCRFFYEIIPSNGVQIYRSSASLSLLIPPSSPISRYIFFMKRKERPLEGEDGNRPRHVRIEILAFVLSTVYTLFSRHCFQRKFTSISIDSKRLFSRKRGTILSRSIGYRYTDDHQFQRFNTPFPPFQRVH